jgi:hypothetical protein
MTRRPPAPEDHQPVELRARTEQIVRFARDFGREANHASADQNGGSRAARWSRSVR